ncbi:MULTISPECIES: hypothetical protein [Enterobacter cloacae complex]|uniref:hypothetical protein n=1 Tax=Enterobacter cloacae complex TaxID=354276 RepID=UPI00307664B3
MKLNLIFIVGMLAYDAHAIRWPSLSEPIISSCNTNSGCNNPVYYKHSGTVFLEQPELIKPPNAASQTIRAYGVHCNHGSRLPGYEQPFSGCHWDPRAGRHAPSTSNCTIDSIERWDLTYNSTCTTGLTWGEHGGAGPGGECVLFGILVGELLHTPMGIVEATTAANSGNRFCVKPLPPATKCELRMNDTILGHGVLAPNGSSTSSVTGVIECGQKPVVEFVGGADFMIAPGVNAALNASVDASTNMITINSKVATVNARGGNYSVSKVITVSPW